MKTILTVLAFLVLGCGHSPAADTKQLKTLFILVDDPLPFDFKCYNPQMHCSNNSKTDDKVAGQRDRGLQGNPSGFEGVKLPVADSAAKDRFSPRPATPRFVGSMTAVTS